jgi:flagellar basal-body rod modification protein FlgD
MTTASTVSIASTVNQQTSAASSTTGASSSQNALTSLSSNFQDFLSLLTTQLQNQDPSSPMDTNEFTSELVEFSSVEQQIDTNASLTQLIQLTQSGDMLNSAAIVGHQVQVTSTQLPLQNSSGTVDFTTPTAEPVTINISDANGNVIESQTLTSTQGANSWSWNGTGQNGLSYPDGAYGVTVTSGTGTAAASVPFTVVGTATGVENSGGTLDVSLGSLDVDFSDIDSLVN